MFAARLWLRRFSQQFSRAAPAFKPRSTARPQQRFASYQRFPNRGGSSAGAGASGQSYKPYSNFTPYARLQYVWRNYQKPVIIVGAGGTTFYVANLEQVPVTHRRRFNIFSPETEKSLMADAAYDQVMQEFKGKILPRTHPYTQTVARIVERLLPAAHGLGGNEWKVHVIEDPNMVNAFVLPGGKVFVFTGLFPVAQDENGLAAVLGHEIGHNVAHHVAERLSSQAFTILAAFALSYVLDVSGQLASSMTDLILTLPNGRTQETEADHIGLLMMAEACYDPRYVPKLWQRMGEAEQKRGGAPPQFLSTHPSSSSRGETIQKWMPEAMELYNHNECTLAGRSFDEFKKLAGTGIANITLPGFGKIPTEKSDDDSFF